MSVDELQKLVRAYFLAKANYESWGPARRLQIKGAVRQRSRAKAQREYDAADNALRAAVGVDGFGNVIAEQP